MKDHIVIIQSIGNKWQQLPNQPDQASIKEKTIFVLCVTHTAHFPKIDELKWRIDL